VPLIVLHQWHFIEFSVACTIDGCLGLSLHVFNVAANREFRKNAIIKPNINYTTPSSSHGHELFNMKFSHYYISLLLSGTMISSGADESCPQTYPRLLPSCALNGGMASTKQSECSGWAADGTALCPNLRPYLPHKFQMVKKNGRDFLRYSGGSANLPDSGTAGGGTFEMVGEADISFDTAFCNSKIPPKERYYQDAVDCQETVQVSTQIMSCRLSSCSYEYSMLINSASTR
jgi:hypothetical protein